MHIAEDRIRMVYKYDNNGVITYKLGLSRKDKDGKYTNGYIPCRFTKDTSLETKTKIKIIDGWLDFYVKEKITYPYIFVNKFEVIEDENLPTNVKTDYDDENSGVKIKDSDLPF